MNISYPKEVLKRTIFPNTTPLDPDPDPLFYHVYGTYPAADYYYNDQADASLNPNGWCDYSAPSNSGRLHGDPISVPGGLQMILAIKHDGDYLDPGVLNANSKMKAR